jgi:7-carboxy-7-deazaguanine synthase
MIQMTGEALPLTDDQQLALNPDPARHNTFPVIEIFGPTIQGEGPDAGRPCYFVRLGGCDYRCDWCDSIYAVDPAEVRKHAERLTSQDILDRLALLPGEADLVVLSGGNPALFDLGEVVRDLQAHSYKVTVETQGSRWKPWLQLLDRLVVSPKPPSSRMATPAHEAETALFMGRAEMMPGVLAIKIVVFSETDYEWALAFHKRHADQPFYLSVGTTQPPEVFVPKGVERDDVILARVLERFRWLCEKVARDPRASKAVVLPQLHVLAWGTARGV